MSNKKETWARVSSATNAGRQILSTATNALALAGVAVPPLLAPAAAGKLLESSLGHLSSAAAKQSELEAELTIIQTWKSLKDDEEISPHQSMARLLTAAVSLAMWWAVLRALAAKQTAWEAPLVSSHSDNIALGKEIEPRSVDPDTFSVSEAWDSPCAEILWDAYKQLLPSIFVPTERAAMFTQISRTAFDSELRALIASSPELSARLSLQKSRLVVDVHESLSPHLTTLFDAHVGLTITNTGTDQLKLMSLKLETIAQIPLDATTSNPARSPISEIWIYGNLPDSGFGPNLLTAIHVLQAGESNGFHLVVKGIEGYFYSFRVCFFWKRIGDHCAVEFSESIVMEAGFPARSAEALLRIATRP